MTPDEINDVLEKLQAKTNDIEAIKPIVERVLNTPELYEAAKRKIDWVKIPVHAYDVMQELTGAKINLEEANSILCIHEAFQKNSRRLDGMIETIEDPEIKQDLIESKNEMNFYHFNLLTLFAYQVQELYNRRVFQ